MQTSIFFAYGTHTYSKSLALHIGSIVVEDA